MTKTLKAQTPAPRAEGAGDDRDRRPAPSRRNMPEERVTPGWRLDCWTRPRVTARSARPASSQARPRRRLHDVIVVPGEERPGDRRQQVHPGAARGDVPGVPAVVTPSVSAIPQYAGAVCRSLGPRGCGPLDAGRLDVEGELVGQAAAPDLASQGADAVRVTGAQIFDGDDTAPPGRRLFSVS